MDANGLSAWAQEAARQPVFVVESGALRQVEGEPPASRAQSLPELLQLCGTHKPLVVSGALFEARPVKGWLEASGADYVLFGDFAPNPTYDQVCAGVRLYREAACDGLLSLGGGSAIDVAKCIQAFAPMDSDGVGVRYTDLPVGEALPPHVAMPTTAGTGSESTHFAVVYVEGVKHSIASHAMLPTAVVLDPSVLGGLARYQKEATMADALCQAIESYWSLRSSPQSRAYSERAIPTIVQHAQAYLEGDPRAAEPMMRAANWAGKAINITTTTAPHALSYKLTSLYGVAHGHAVALCMPFLWDLLIQRGGDVVQQYLVGIARLMSGTDDPHDGLRAFEELVAGFFEGRVPAIAESDIPALVASVNQQRLRNFPIELSQKDIERAYRSLLRP